MAPTKKNKSKFLAKKTKKVYQRRGRGRGSLTLHSLTPVAKGRVQEFRTKVEDFLKNSKHTKKNKKNKITKKLAEIDVCSSTAIECGAYPRYVLPQIDDLGSFLKDAKKIGIPLHYTTETRILDQLKPSQSEALKSRVKSTATDIKTGKLDLNKNPIIISRNGDIIDGHHRYFALIQLKRTAESIPVRVVDAPTLTILEAAAAVGLPRAPQVGWSGLNPGGI